MVGRLGALAPNPDPADLELARAVEMVHGRPEVPGHLDVFYRDALGAREPLHEDRVHLDAALAWLLESQRRTGCGGFAAGYCFNHGWLPPYPETTGYIIETLWDARRRLAGRHELEASAIAAADWEIDIQMEDGAVQAGYYGTDPENFWKGDRVPAAFNTGQVMLGWNRSFQETGSARFLEAAIRAGHHLAGCIDDDGVFRRGLSPGPTNPTRAYYTRVAHALAWTGRLGDEPRFVERARRHLDWAATQERDDGWFVNANFHIDEPPLTHTLAYTAEGLLDAGLLLDEPHYVDASARLSRGAMTACERRGFFLPATFGPGWKSADTYACLTGNAQFAALWLRHGMAEGDLPLINAGLKMIDMLKGVHALDNPCPGIRGGIAGAWPIDGGYSIFRYLNWATKFFVDALMLGKDAKKEIERIG